MKMVGFVACLTVPFALLYVLVRISRWKAGRDDKIHDLIRTPRWCKDGAGYMNVPDYQKLNRAGEIAWQEALRAQRKARHKPKAHHRPSNVREFRKVIGQ